MDKVKDTSEAIERFYLDEIMKRSGEERVKMACSMYDTARAIVVSSIQEDQQCIPESEMKKRIFERFYGLEFAEAQKKRIFKMWE